MTSERGGGGKFFFESLLFPSYIMVTGKHGREIYSVVKRSCMI